MRGHEGEGSNEAARLCKRHLVKRTSPFWKISHIVWRQSSDRSRAPVWHTYPSPWLHPSTT